MTKTPLLALCLALPLAAAAADYDLLITNARIVDGTGAAATTGSVGIKNGRIVAVKRPRGRPPKHPRPVVVVDEVPIPPHLVA